MRNKPKSNKAKNLPKEGKRQKDTRQIAVPWGRAASEYRRGVFSKSYFEKHSETCCADVFRALNEDLERINRARAEIGEIPIRGSTYNSFAKHWHWFKLLGLIEPVDRQESSIFPFLQKRVFYKLTNKGKTEERAWEDPIGVAHPELR
jgi:hypothetical protein